MTHPNGERLLGGFAAFAAGDLAALEELFAPEVEWTIPGRSRLAGTARGLPAVLELVRSFASLTGGSYGAAPRWVLADEEHAVVGYRATGSREGRSIDIDQALLCRFEQGRIVEVLGLPTDPDAFDAFWS